MSPSGDNEPPEPVVTPGTDPPTWRTTGGATAPAAPRAPGGAFLAPGAPAGTRGHRVGPRPPVRVPDNVAFLDVPGAPPVTKADGGVWLLLTLVGFVVGQILALIFIEVVAAMLGKGSQVAALSKLSVPPEWLVASSLVGLWVGFFGAPWLASRIRGTGHFFADLGLRFKWIDLVGIAIGIGGQLLVAIVYAPFIKHLHNFNGPTNKLTGGAHGAGFAVIALFTIVGAPFMEELFFRGLLFKALARLFVPGAATRSVARTLGVGSAVVADGLLFGLAHGELEQLAGLALFGAILAFVTYRTGRLGMNMVAHASFNAVAIIAVLHTRGGLIH